MFSGFTSLWIMGGLQASCKYSSATIQIPIQLVQEKIVEKRTRQLKENFLSSYAH